MKRVGASIGKIVLAMMGLLLFLVCLIYTPAFQHYIKNRAVRYLTENYGFNVQVGDIRLAFPLNLSLNEVYCGATSTDTILALKGLHLDVELGQLFFQQVKITDFVLKDLVCHWQDSSGMKLDAVVGTLQLVANVDLTNSR